MFVWHTASQQTAALCDAFSNLIPFIVFDVVYSILFNWICQDISGTFLRKAPEILCFFLHIYIMSDLNDPTVFILGLSPLDACECFVKISRNLTDISVVNGVFRTLVAELSDGRNNGCCSASPSLFKR